MNVYILIYADFTRNSNQSTWTACVLLLCGRHSELFVTTIVHTLNIANTRAKCATHQVKYVRHHAHEACACASLRRDEQMIHKYKSHNNKMCSLQCQCVFA